MECEQNMTFSECMWFVLDEINIPDGTVGSEKIALREGGGGAKKLNPSLLIASVGHVPQKQADRTQLIQQEGF